MFAARKGVNAEPGWDGSIIRVSEQAAGSKSNLEVRENVITQSRKFPGAPQTSTPYLCKYIVMGLGPFNVMLGTVPRHSIRDRPFSSTTVLRSTLSHRINPSRRRGTLKSHILDENGP